MQRARDYVEHLKRKPVHERERIAMLVSSALVGVVALGYLGALTSSDSLALRSSPQASVAQNSSENFSNLMGAAAAFSSTMNQSDGEITVVESKRTSTLESTDTSSATVIPF